MGMASQVEISLTTFIHFHSQDSETQTEICSSSGSSPKPSTAAES